MRELLASIPDNVNIYIWDNASTDETQNIDKEKYIYHRNPENIGGPPNIYQAYTKAEGDYIWVIGDDELLPPGAVETVLEKIKLNPGLIIVNCPDYVHHLTQFVFENYREFAQVCERVNPHLLIAHSLISANVIRKDCFDKTSDFPHDYGNFYRIINALSDTDKVVFCEEHTLTVRQSRAGPIDGVWNGDLISAQRVYLQWVKERYGLSIIPESIV